MTGKQSEGFFERWVMRPLRAVGRAIARVGRWLCRNLYIIGIIVMIVGIGVAVLTSWTIAGIGAGAVVFVIGFVLFLVGVLCRWVF